MPHFTDVAKVADREYNGWVGRGLGVWKGGARLWGGGEQRGGGVRSIRLPRGTGCLTSDRGGEVVGGERVGGGGSGQFDGRHCRKG